MTNVDLNPQKIDSLTSASTLSNRREWIAKIGTLFSAVLASACCWLPLVLLAMGVSGAGITSALEAYRPLFIVVTFGFLGAAFYFTYRPRKSLAGNNDCCAPTAARRLSMMFVNKVVLWAVTVLAIALLLFPNYASTLLGFGNDSKVTSDMNQAVLMVEGMTCESCAAVVSKAIRDVPGVQAVEVDYKTREAVIGTNSDSAVPKDDILAALRRAGYDGLYLNDLGCCAPSQPGAQSSVQEDKPTTPLTNRGTGSETPEPN